MISRKYFTGTSPHCRAILATTVFVLLGTIVSHGTSLKKTECTNLCDSMIVAGLQSLARNNISVARQQFTVAYRCGMSKDSMYYFAAEIYLRSGIPDTALTFNWALEKGGHFSRPVYLEQRVRIYRMIGWNHAADSVETFFRKKNRHDIFLNISGARNNLVLDDITILPQQWTFKPSGDIDDAGDCAIRYRWSLYTTKRFRKIFMELYSNTQIPVPTQYSFDEINDTLMRTYSIAFGVGNLPFTPECVVGYRARIHSDGKVDHYFQGNLSSLMSKSTIVSVMHDLKLIRNEGIDDSRTEISLLKITEGWPLKQSFGVSFGHHFAKLDMYQNQLDIWGKRSTMPIGFVDSLKFGNYYYSYYKDQGITIPFKSPFLDEYWNAQPGLQLLENPEHDLNAAIKTSVHFSIPWELKFNIVGAVQTIWYPKKVRFYTFDKSLDVVYEDLYENYALLFNAADGKYYLNVDRSSRTTPEIPFETVTIQHNEKQRIDLFISLSMILQKQYITFGTFYLSASYLKCFSTMNKNDPVGILDYLWNLNAGWQKGFSFGRK